MENFRFKVLCKFYSALLLAILLLISNLLHAETLPPYEDLTTWTPINGIIVTDLQDGAYQLEHPGTNWPILNKDLPPIPANAQIRV